MAANVGAQGTLHVEATVSAYCASAGHQFKLGADLARGIFIAGFNLRPRSITTLVIHLAGQIRPEKRALVGW